jgi:hypothetical protein
MLARNPTSLLSLIAWLKTKNPNESYKFSCTQGTCLFSQYLNQSVTRTRAPHSAMPHPNFAVTTR